MENVNHDSKIDVRIIVGGLDIAQLVSKAVNNIDRKSTRLNSSHIATSRMPSSA